MNLLKSAVSGALLLALATTAQADLDSLVNAALDGPTRTDEEKARDANRKPLETLKFFRLEPNMRVLELVPGGGWYTKILAPTLRDEGKLYLSIGAERLENSLLKEPGFDKVEVVTAEGDIGRGEGRRMLATRMSFDVKDIDLVLTFRNLHNFEEPARRAINQASFDVLKPGGLYGVIDHTRRHMEGETGDNWRRMDPVAMIKEIESIGFEFVDYSDLHARPVDALNLEVGKPEVSGQTDRFTLLFKKPE